MNSYHKNLNGKIIVPLIKAIACCTVPCLSVFALHAQTAPTSGFANGTSHSIANQPNQSQPTYIKTANGFPIVLPRVSGDSTQHITNANPMTSSPSVAPIQHNTPFVSPTLAFTPPKDIAKIGVDQESIASDTVSESIQLEPVNVTNAAESSPQPIAAAPPNATPSVPAPAPSTVTPTEPTSTPSTASQLTEPSHNGSTEWDEVGYASWYGGKFQGRQTANGEIFDTNKLTAAHKTLPFNSMVQVYNPTNQQSVLVRINDRGPFVESRIIDLSRAAASIIGLTSQGISQVYIKVVSEGVSQDLKLIQLGSFGVYENAIDLKTELEQAGIKVEIESGANSIYRVIVPDLTADELLAMRTRLADLGYSDVLVRSVK